MSKPTRYKRGDWNAVCDACGQRYPASALRKRWDGLMVCNKDWETRHPQEFVKARVDEQTVPWTRPESTDYIYVAIDYDRIVDPDVFSMKETINKSLVKPTTESFTITESVVPIRGLYSSQTDSLSLTESFSKATSKIITEVLTLAENFVASLSFPQIESFSLAESFTAFFSKPVTESLSLSEDVTTSLFTPGINAINQFSINSHSLG